MRVTFEEMRSTIKLALVNVGVPEAKAELCAEIHTESSADGVESHGLNRIPRFVDYIRKGYVDVHAEPTLIAAKGAAENYDGHMGIGVTNALFASDQAVRLAKLHGIGLVTLKNTTHWMRGGTYAWRTANKGYMGISWINTEDCMPLWGSDEQSVGNNPFCIAIPRDKGPIVLDMAMSQYAYGKLGVYQLSGKQTEYPCGFDENGRMTTDPGEVIKTRRIMPTGYWKGSSMAIALDLAATMMSNGNSGTEITHINKGSCGGCSQIFIAYDPYLFGDKSEIDRKIEERIIAADAAHPLDEKHPVHCPGESTIHRREVSMRDGIHVDDSVWKQVQEYAAGRF